MSHIIEEIMPADGDRILIYDIAASESGALSVLSDFYNQVCMYGKFWRYALAFNIPLIPHYLSNSI